MNFYRFAQISNDLHGYSLTSANEIIRDFIENSYNEDYRKLIIVTGKGLHSENEKGEKQSFIVTRIDDETLTVDGNNPLCGRMVNFNLEILGVRDAVEEEIEAGGPIDKGPDIPEALTVPLH